MGADLCLSILIVPTKIEKNLKGAFMQMRGLLKTITKDEVMSWYVDSGRDKEYDAIDLEMEQIEMQKILDILEENLTDGYRDTTDFYHKGDRIFLTGGMSYGDAPTDSYETFDSFLAMPLRITGFLTDKFRYSRYRKPKCPSNRSRVESFVKRL